MQKRPLGRTGHKSTIAILGAFAFSEATQTETDAAMEEVLEAGINHIDVAPTYGQAEQRLGPWMKRERERFFLGCKTMARDRTGAARELRESLDRLQVDRFDLYQLHAVTTREELDAALSPGGAIEALLQAREEGLTRYLGITSHGINTPALLIQALERFDFDTVLFPINYIQYTNPAYRAGAAQLLDVCQEKEVGTMIIKAVARGRWGEEKPTYNTWYKPFEGMKPIQDCVNFALSHPVTGICTAGDLQLLPKVIHACEHFQALTARERERLIQSGTKYQPLFQKETSP